MNVDVNVNVNVYVYVYVYVDVDVDVDEILVELSYAPSSGLQQSFAQCPVLPQFLHVFMSVELVLVVLVGRFPFWLWGLPLPFPLPFLRESTCIRSSSALVTLPADTVGFAPKFREEKQHCNKADRRATLLGYVPNCKLFLRKIGAMFIITMYLTKRVPILRHPAPRLSRLIQNLPRGRTRVSQAS